MKIAMKTKSILLLFLICGLTLTARCQTKTTKVDLVELLGQNKINVFNRELTKSNDVNYRAVHLSAKGDDGIAWIEGLDFSNGVIEIDIKGKDALQQSFVGIAFHGVDEKILDAIYFRPFNFQSSDSIRKIHAVQYVSHPDFPWQVLREKYNGKYEKGIASAPGATSWFHAKIVVEYPTIKVFVNNNSEASLTVDQLNKRFSGKLGLWVGNNSDGDFANLVLKKTGK